MKRAKFFGYVVMMVVSAVTAIGSAHAQDGVELENPNVRLGYNRRSQVVSASGQVDVANYGFDDVGPASVKLGLSPRPVTAGQSIGGFLLAQTRIGTLYGRTRFRNVALNGSGRVTRGTYYLVMLVSKDDTREVAAVIQATRRVAVSLTSPATTARRLKRSLHHASALRAGPGALTTENLK